MSDYDRSEVEEFFGFDLLDSVLPPEVPLDELPSYLPSNRGQRDDGGWLEVFQANMETEFQNDL